MQQPIENCYFSDSRKIYVLPEREQTGKCRRCDTFLKEEICRICVVVGTGGSCCCSGSKGQYPSRQPWDAAGSWICKYPASALSSNGDAFASHNKVVRPGEDIETQLPLKAFPPPS